MSEVAKFLEANPVQCLATVGRGGKAKCRPFMFSFEKDGKLWFNTGNQKDVYKDMQENPNVEICISSPSSIVKGNYQTPDNPTFAVFYLADAKAVIADFSGNPPREYTF